MRILIRTRPFYPSIGGLEAVMQMLAEEFAKAGHAVTVVTASLNDKPDAFPFEVLRKPSLARLWQAHRDADVVIFGNISLWWFLTLCLCPRPWVATHHGWYFDTGSPVKWMDRLKVALAGLANANVSVSAAVNRFLGHPGIVIPNPFDHDTFRLMPDVPRDRDLVFLGRLVSDKGADVLVETLALLKHKGLRPGLTMIGGGPELENLQKQASSLGVEDQIHFAGPRRGEELARALNTHRIMVIPSRWNEPFGVVALEGIACGCVIVASSGGGLPEAAGLCGVSFPNLDASALAARLEDVLTRPELVDRLRSAAPDHLARHDRKAIAASYLEVLRHVVD
jgi:glycosyltransferase involved in cell wall biosynthesis